jgi:predicted GNAT family acetyltransferase
VSAEGEPRVVDNTNADRYEMFIGGDLVGFAEYKASDGHMLFTYIEVEPALQGRMLGSTLTAAALDDCRARGLTVSARCPFIVDYLRNHPEYDDIKAEG